MSDQERCEYQKRVQRVRDMRMTTEVLEVIEFMDDPRTHHYAEVMHDIMLSLSFLKGTPAHFTNAVRYKVIADLNLISINTKEDL